ncbi:hypothetical protein EPN87_01060 [archaeon]|nr:MAG: hypothetical protein EPN87_01060 [archaeon]
MVNLAFLKKKGAEAVHGKGFSPTDRVRELAGRGFSEPEMIDVLRREGFSPEEIDNGLTQALAVGAGGQPNVPQQFNPPEPAQQKAEQPQQQLPTLEQLVPEQAQMPQVPETSLPEQYYQQYPSEEYIDAVVQSRVQDVEEKMKDFSAKNQDLAKTVNVLQEKLDQIAKGQGGGQQQILSKIDGFDENLSDISMRMGNLEKAFKETLPALIESVRSLSDIVQMMKKEG